MPYVEEETTPAAIRSTLFRTPSSPPRSFGARPHTLLMIGISAVVLITTAGAAASLLRASPSVSSPGAARRELSDPRELSSVMSSTKEEVVSAVASTVRSAVTSAVREQLAPLQSQLDRLERPDREKNGTTLEGAMEMLQRMNDLGAKRYVQEVQRAEMLQERIGEIQGTLAAWKHLSQHLPSKPVTDAGGEARAAEREPPPLASHPHRRTLTIVIMPSPSRAAPSAVPSRWHHCS